MLYCKIKKKCSLLFIVNLKIFNNLNLPYIYLWFKEKKQKIKKKYIIYQFFLKLASDNYFSIFTVKNNNICCFFFIIDLVIYIN